MPHKTPELHPIVERMFPGPLSVELARWESIDFGIRATPGILEFDLTDPTPRRFRIRLRFAVGCRPA